MLFFTNSHVYEKKTFYVNKKCYKFEICLQVATFQQINSCLADMLQTDCRQAVSTNYGSVFETIRD